MGTARYAWVTLLPLASSSVTTLTAGVPERPRQLLADGDRGRSARHVQGYVDTALTIIMMVCVIVILSSAVWRCTQVLRGRIAITPATAR